MKKNACDQRLSRIMSDDDDHPSESRPYKQYCTTLLTLVKAEAILIGSHLQGDVDAIDFWFKCECVGPQLSRGGREKEPQKTRDATPKRLLLLCSYQEVPSRG